MSLFKYRLYLVTDERACRGKDFFKTVESAVKGGVDLVQIREKNLPEPEFLTKTLRLKEMLDRYNVPLVVNDSLFVAEKSGAAGIHVGNNDTPPAFIRANWLGCSILGYSLEYEEHLQSENAVVSDYIALSPVFATTTKTDTITEWGIEGIRQVRSKTLQPLVAIGNITVENARSIIEAGANCLAVVSAICSAENPAYAAELLRNQIEKATII